MATEWVDFKALRGQLSFQQVLQHYKVEVKTKGGRQHHGYCLCRTTMEINILHRSQRIWRKESSSASAARRKEMSWTSPCSWTAEAKTTLLTCGEPLDDLIIVEGFASVWWLWQHGMRNMEALMGSSCDEKQVQVIVSHTKPNGRVWLITDGDNAGDLCAASTLPQVSRLRFVRWVKLDEGKQPTDHTGDELRALLKQ